MNTHQTTHLFHTQHTGGEESSSPPHDSASALLANNSNKPVGETHSPDGGIPSSSWQLKGHSEQSLICQWARGREAFAPLAPDLKAKPLHCPHHCNNPPGPGNEPWDMSRFQRNLAWLLIGGGVDYLLDNENLEVVERVSQITNKTAQSIEWYVGRRINRAFAPWVDDPLAFRELMRSTRSIVSGSLALQAAVAAPWTCNDMDVYVPSGDTRDKFIDYLQKQESYYVLGTWDLNAPRAKRQPFFKFIASVTRMKRTIRTLRGTVTRRIRLLQSTRDATKPVASFSASWCMNWIGADEITVLYPEMTFAHTGVLNHARKTTNLHALWLSKYISRGFQLVDCAPNTGPSLWPCSALCTGRRRIDTGDDSFLSTTSTYRWDESPEKTWIAAGWRRLSDFAYICLDVDHGDLEATSPAHVLKHNNYRLWQTLYAEA